MHVIISLSTHTLPSQYKTSKNLGWRGVCCYLHDDFVQLDLVLSQTFVHGLHLQQGILQGGLLCLSLVDLQLQLGLL